MEGREAVDRAEEIGIERRVGTADDLVDEDLVDDLLRGRQATGATTMAFGARSTGGMCAANVMRCSRPLVFALAGACARRAVSARWFIGTPAATRRATLSTA